MSINLVRFYSTISLRAYAWELFAASRRLVPYHTARDLIGQQSFLPNDGPSCASYDCLLRRTIYLSADECAVIRELAFPETACPF